MKTFCFVCSFLMAFEGTNVSIRIDDIYWSGSVHLISQFFYDQDLAGEVVQNLHEFFRTMYKKVISFCLVMENFWFHVILLFIFRLERWHVNTCIGSRLLRQILKSLKQTTEDLIQRRMIWLTCTKSARVIWTGTIANVFPFFFFLGLPDQPLICFPSQAFLFNALFWP